MERPRSADTFARTRDDHATEVAEDYVEAVADLIAEHGTCRVTDLAQAFGVSHVTVVRVVQRLEREGLAVAGPRRPIVLTEEGEALAAHCRRRHDIVFRFLCALGVPEEVALHDAEGMEHHVSAETLAIFERHLDRS